MKTHPVQAALDRAGLPQVELATFMGVDPSTLSNKLTGRRRWTQSEINTALDFFRQHDPSITYEQLFGADPKEAA